MKNICLIFHTHQSVLLNKFRFFDIGASTGSYFNYESNRTKMQRNARDEFGPINRQLIELFNQFTSNFKISFAFSGTTLDLMESYCPNIIKELKKINDLGNVEFLGETYSHSVLSSSSEQEFFSQVSKQKNKVLNLFGQYPRSFFNTNDFSLDFLNSVLPFLDFDIVINKNTISLPEGASPYSIFQLKDKYGEYMLYSESLFDHMGSGKPEEAILLQSNYADQFINMVSSLPDENAIACLIIDYKHLISGKKGRDILIDFLQALPKKAYESNIGFITPLEAALSEAYAPMVIPVTQEGFHHHSLNELQQEILDILTNMKEKVYQTKDESIIKAWYYLQDDINLHEMSWSNNSLSMQKNDSNPFGSYINYRNILGDLTQKIEDLLTKMKRDMQSHFYANYIKSHMKTNGK